MPNKHTKEAVFEFDNNGNFRLVVRLPDGTIGRSQWALYMGIAVLEMNGETYIAVSRFYESEGRFRPECVMHIDRVLDTETYHVKGHMPR